MKDTMANQAGTWPERVKELEAEVERLRGVPLHELAEKESEHWHDLKAYRAAVAEVRAEVTMGLAKLKDGTARNHYEWILQRLDKLPRHEP